MFQQKIKHKHLANLPGLGKKLNLKNALHLKKYSRKLEKRTDNKMVNFKLSYMDDSMKCKWFLNFHYEASIVRLNKKMRPTYYLYVMYFK